MQRVRLAEHHAIRPLLRATVCRLNTGPPRSKLTARRPNRRIALAAAIGLAALAAACGSPAPQSAQTAPASSGELALADDRIPREVKAVDVTPSAGFVTDSLAAAVNDSIVDAASRLNGTGSSIQVYAIGGGPADLRSVSHEVICSEGSRKCLDETAIEERIAPVLADVDLLLAAEPVVGGSDPIGATFVLLSDEAERYGANPSNIEIWSDFVNRSDLLDLEEVDISTASLREEVIAALASRGIDFAMIDLDESDRITVWLIPGDISSQSAVFTEFVDVFIEQLLGRTGATVDVLQFTSTE